MARDKLARVTPSTWQLRRAETPDMLTLTRRMSFGPKNTGLMPRPSGHCPARDPRDRLFQLLDPFVLHGILILLAIPKCVLGPTRYFSASQPSTSATVRPGSPRTERLAFQETDRERRSVQDHVVKVVSISRGQNTHNKVTRSREQSTLQPETTTS